MVFGRKKKIEDPQIPKIIINMPSRSHHRRHTRNKNPKTQSDVGRTKVQPRTVPSASKFSALKAKFTGTLTSASLRRNYLRKRNIYKRLEDDEVINEFMSHFKFYLKEDARMRGDAAHPGKFLLDLSRLGYYGISIFYGQIPVGKEHILLPMMKAYLVKHFRLDNFRGFGLHFSKKHRLSEITTVSISWYQPTAKDVVPETHPSMSASAETQDTLVEKVRLNSQTKKAQKDIIKEQSEIIKNMTWLIETMKNPSDLLFGKDADVAIESKTSTQAPMAPATPAPEPTLSDIANKVHGLKKGKVRSASLIEILNRKPDSKESSSESGSETSETSETSTGSETSETSTGSGPKTQTSTAD